MGFVGVLIIVRPGFESMSTGTILTLIGTAFTIALVVGAVTSIVTPAVTGALVPNAGLGTVLVLSGAVAVTSAAALAAGLPVRAAVRRARARTT